MSGIFSMWQPRYAERGVPTFPVDETKKPRIRSWQSVGLKGSAELANKFDDANALGYVTGRRSNVTVLDIDTTEENIAADAIQRHGQPAIITRTASGKFHHLYRYNGERRRIRPWSELPIDLLGDNGYALAAPSKTATGSRRVRPSGPVLKSCLYVPVGDRWRILSLAARGIARKSASIVAAGASSGLRKRSGGGASLDRMMEIARDVNQQFKEPLMDTEVVKVAASAWQHDAAGLNFFTRPRIMLDHDIFDVLGGANPDALLVLLRQERYHGGNDTFALANAMASSMAWGLPRWQRARDYLVKVRIIGCIHPGGHGPNDPPIYGWAIRN